jgi:hypothetical protein
MTATTRRSARRLGAGVYLYRGIEIRNDHDSEDYAGWWATYAPGDADPEDYWPTKRAAMAAIDADPPR